ncbi:MAG: phosphoribosylglycinamide formyltransferase [Bacteroidetes bacterium]|nr:MAG: phosphoribosylglycinamide formyltransferase [Bacteroidota bacterium]
MAVNISIWASGSGTNAENITLKFKNHPFIKVKMIVTNNPDAQVIQRAEKLKKTVHIIPKNILFEKTDRVIELLQQEEIDLIVLAGFLLKIPEKIIHHFPNRIINIHPALLPKYGGKGFYGENVHKAVLANKEKESGITIHYVNEEYDEGQIIFQTKCPVHNEDTAETLSQKIHQLEYEYYPVVIEQVAGEIADKKKRQA